MLALAPNPRCNPSLCTLALVAEGPGGGELSLLELQEAEELGGGGAALDLAEVDVAEGEARQSLVVKGQERENERLGWCLIEGWSRFLRRSLARSA